MRALLQRVSEASVTVNGQVVSAIGPGLLVLLGVGQEDAAETAISAEEEADLHWLATKVARLRVFPDAEGHMNRSLVDRLEAGEPADAIVVSQFTLHANHRKGQRPSFVRAARPEAATPRYERFVAALSVELGKPVGTGVFGAHMDVALVNDGPVTIWIDSRERGY
jgi:D-tyrosyl-tRNA(Tyr) deacylase